MDSRILGSIRSVYFNKSIADKLERSYKYYRERILGVDYSIFDKTILYYREVIGRDISKGEALSKALDKKVHKDAWFKKKRDTIEDIMSFYKEDDFYLFRHPFLRRFGGFRWYVHLVDHVNNPSILEYGCGAAVLTEYLIERFPLFTYTVADIPSTTLDFVKWKKVNFGFGYNILIIGDGTDKIPLRQNYDLIVCKEVLEHTPNPLEIVSSFIEHLLPGGVLVIDFINESGAENLEVALEQRDPVKRILDSNLIAIKKIDEFGRNDGLYVKAGI